MSLLTISSQEFTVVDPEPSKELTGPEIPLDYRIWKTLTDYSKWADWMEDVYDVTLNDPISALGRDFGRGSTFYLYGTSGVRTLQILYWSPCQKLIYSVTSSQLKIAYCFEIEFTPELQQASIVLSGEIEIFGFERLISWFVGRRYKKIFSRQSRRLAALLNDKGL